MGRGYRHPDTGGWVTGGRDEDRVDRTEAAKEAFRRAWRPERPIEGAIADTDPPAADRHLGALAADAEASPTAARKRELEAHQPKSRAARETPGARAARQADSDGEPGSAARREFAELDSQSKTARQLSPGARAARQADSDGEQRDTRHAARQLFELAKHGFEPGDLQPAGGSRNTELDPQAIDELAEGFDDRVEDFRARDVEQHFDTWLQEEHGLTADEFDQELEELDEDEQETVLDVVMALYDTARGHDTNYAVEPDELDWDDSHDPGDAPDWDARATPARGEHDADSPAATGSGRT